MFIFVVYSLAHSENMIANFLGNNEKMFKRRFVCILSYSRRSDQFEL